jgi:hypothetical protein
MFKPPLELYFVVAAKPLCGKIIEGNESNLKDH